MVGEQWRQYDPAVVRAYVEHHGAIWLVGESRNWDRQATRIQRTLIEIDSVTVWRPTVVPEPPWRNHLRAWVGQEPQWESTDEFQLVDPDNDGHPFKRIDPDGKVREIGRWVHQE